jgi:hypothetical protein
MTPEVKERLYRELVSILIAVENRNIGEAQSSLEDLVNKVAYNRV